MVIMKAMGIESDQEVVQMIGRDPRYGALLLPSLQVLSNQLLSLQMFYGVLDFCEMHDNCVYFWVRIDTSFATKINYV